MAIENESGSYSKETWLPYYTDRINRYTNAISYDAIGNITKKEQHNKGTYLDGSVKELADTSYTWDYTYGGTPHAVTQSGTLTYTYDANGNMTAKADSGITKMALTWNEENRLTKTKVLDTITTYRYDDAGTRVVKKGDNGETLYINQNYSIKNGQYECTHVFAGQTRIATKMQTKTTNTATVDTGVYFYHPDHLGSSSTVTNKSGGFTEHNEYFPYGELWISETTSDVSLPFKYTSKEFDTETGLYYYGARYLDPKIGGWCSVDPPMVRGEYFPTGDKDKDENLPGMGGIFNSVNLNVYHYAGNNPVRFTDPNGKEDYSADELLVNSVQKQFLGQDQCGEFNYYAGNFAGAVKENYKEFGKGLFVGFLEGSIGPDLSFAIGNKDSFAKNAFDVGKNNGNAIGQTVQALAVLKAGAVEGGKAIAKNASLKIETFKSIGKAFAEAIKPGLNGPRFKTFKEFGGYFAGVKTMDAYWNFFNKDVNKDPKENNKGKK